MADLQRFDAGKAAADSRNQASMKMKQAEVSRMQAEAQRMQAEAKARLGAAKRFQGDQVMAKMKVNQAKNLANRPEPA